MYWGADNLDFLPFSSTQRYCLKIYACQENVKDGLKTVKSYLGPGPNISGQEDGVQNSEMVP